MTINPEQSLKLFFLGAPQLLLGGQALTEQISGKPLALLIYLAVTGQSHTRDQLADLLWSELSNQQARANLRYLLPDLRQAVDDYLLITPQTISFNRQTSYWLDVEVLQTTLTNTPAAVSTVALQAALDLYQREFLAGFTVRNAPVFEGWMMHQREVFHRLAMQGFYLLAERHQQAGDFHAGLATIQRLLHWEPWHEAGHRLQMQLLAANGQRSAALAQYALCRAILADELGAEPEPATTALFEEIRNGKFSGKEAERGAGGKTRRRGDKETGLAGLSLFPSPLLSSPLPHNLPGQLTPFIGRRTEIDQLCSLLADPARRLVTLTGLGGIGKTRLALAIGQRIVNADSPEAASSNTLQSRLTEGMPQSGQRLKFPDGVWFVPLIGIAADENVAEGIAVAVMEALQWERSGTVAPTEQLLAALHNRRLLLILDNFEHLIDGVSLLLTLLQRTTSVKLLVTSRRILNLQAEVVWQLEGLSTPTPAAAPALTPGEAQRYDSVALFIERIQHTNHSFQLDQANQNDVFQICYFVEGLPLGIELAAAMLRYTSCSELWHTLQQDYRILAVTQRDVPPRHRTITAVFDYSWRLLNPDQARVLAACTIFPQAFSVEAATVITGSSTTVLWALVDHSLLRQTEEGRFEIHELVRQYAMDQLQKAPQVEMQCRQRHADYYSHLLETDPDELMRTPTKLHLVQQELPNLRMVWHWSLEQHQLAPLMRLGEGLFLHFLARGSLLEGWTLAHTLVERLRRWPTVPQNEAEARFFAFGPVALAYLGFYQGRYAEVAQLAQEAIAIAQPLADTFTLARAYGILGMIALGQGDAAAHEAHCRTALAYARLGAVRHITAVALTFLGFGLAVQGKLNEALAGLHEALQLVQEQHFFYIEGLVLSELSSVYAITGDWAQADKSIEQALQRSQGQNNSLHRGHQYARLAISAEAVGDYTRAMAWTEQALAFSTLVPDPSSQWPVLLVRGRVLRHAGNLEEATSILQQVLPLTQTLGRPIESIETQVELGQIAYECQAWQSAAVYYRAALATAAASNLPIPVSAQAGLAQVYFQQHQLAEALVWVEGVCTTLFTQPLEKQYHVADAALVSHRVLTAAHDPRSTLVLQRACQWLEAQALKISDDSMRRSFLENIFAHRQLLELAQLAAVTTASRETAAA